MNVYIFFNFHIMSKSFSINHKMQKMTRKFLTCGFDYYSYNINIIFQVNSQKNAYR